MPATSDFTPIRTEFCGVSVSELAQKYGTPLFVYDAALIKERIQDLSEFDVVRYAQKACSNIAILDLVRKAGALVDSVSAGEIHRAIKAGYAPGGDPPRIVYTADVFDHDALDLVVEHGIHVNVGSPDMIDQLGERAPGSTITLRINPGFGHGHSQKTNTGGEQSKHGIWFDQAVDCVERAAKYDMTVTGLHMHIGSGTDFEHLSEVCDALEKTAESIGESLISISAGGGLPIPYTEDDTYIDLGKYFQLWNAVRKRLEAKFGHDVSLEIEPGRFLTAEAGVLLTEIRAVKTMGENTFYLVDAGFNNLARPILYGAYHPMSICPLAPGETEPDLQQVVVGGPLCESGDIFTQTEGGFVNARPLPKASVGDLLLIERAGAYGAVMSSNYNSKPFAAEVLIDTERPSLIRARQDYADLFRDEFIPND